MGREERTGTVVRAAGGRGLGAQPLTCRSPVAHACAGHKTILSYGWGLGRAVPALLPLLACPYQPLRESSVGLAETIILA